MRRLAMPAADLEVVVEAAEPGEDGADRVVFLLAANAGEAAQPLAKVASGGELSRAMLALRVALAERGGRGAVRSWCSTRSTRASVARPVPRSVGSWRRSAESAQVLCITHLAQVAACADAQVVVRKAERGGRTTASARPVAERGPGGGALAHAGGRRGLRPRPSTRGGALEREPTDGRGAS